MSRVMNTLAAPTGASTIGDTRNILRNPLLNTLNESDVTPSMISRVIEDANRALEPSFFRLSFSIHDATARVMIQVIDTASEEILREIPPESKLNTMAKILEFAGLLFDQKS
jgi:flagellar protein FlaG